MSVDNNLTTNRNSLFRSRDWLSANQGPKFPGPVDFSFSLLSSCRSSTLILPKILDSTVLGRTPNGSPFNILHTPDRPHSILSEPSQVDVLMVGPHGQPLFDVLVIYRRWVSEGIELDPTHVVISSIPALFSVEVVEV